MKRSDRIASPVARIAAAGLLCATAAPAQAYIDPGTGSMLIQLVAAGIAGALFFLRDLRNRIATWFSFGRRARNEEAGEPRE